ncbi:hypothetical protein HWV62_14556 [Athelia sp. TMB]|nr:hypothetical protein HWV62_14556 [Athelia sp. TMB]
MLPTRSRIWYEDGTVVVEAEKTQFKVHRSLLSQSSSVFRDMFTSPQPLNLQEELVEGCPVVQLTDSKMDVEHVFDALFRPREFLGKPLPIGVVAAFLRLGMKYDIDALRKEALRRLYYEFPVDFDTFLATDDWTMTLDRDLMSS